jgi:uncharacterized protein
VSDPRKTVNAIYEAFGRGEIPTILSYLAADIQWEYAWTNSPIPWLAPGTGRDHAARCFGIMQEQLEFHRFEVNQVLSGTQVVVALIGLDVTVRATGQHIVETDEPHIWYFDDAGLVRKFRHAADTYQHYQALQDG